MRGRSPLRIIIIIALVAIGAFLLIGFVRQYIAPLVLRSLWNAYLMSGSIPQVMIWAVFVAAIPIVAVMTLIRSQTPADEDIYGPPSQNPGRVTVWQEMLHKSSGGDYYRQRLRRNLADLALSALQHRERLTADEAKNHLRSGQLPASPEVSQYLARGWERRNLVAEPERPQGRLARILRGTESDRPEPFIYDPLVDAVIEFLEREVEVDSGS